MAFIPWGPWSPDTSDFEGTAVHNIQNVAPRGDGYGPFPDFTALSAALPGPCRGAFYALKSDGSTIVFAGTATKLYKMDNSAFTWTDVSLSGGSYGALSASANWQFAQTGSLIWATQANAVLQVFDLSSATTFVAGLGSPPQAAYIAVVGQFLVLSGLLSFPYRIQWSGLESFNASTSWTAGVGLSDFQDFTDGGIVRGVAGGENGVIFQDQAIRSMSFIPGSDIVFQIERMTQDMGLYAPYSIIRSGSTVFFYAGQGFYKIDPGSAPVQIGRERVDRFFLGDLDKNNLQLFVGASDPRNTRVYWAYKSGAGMSGTYDKILGYDRVLDRFFPIAMTGEYLLGISQSGLTLENLDSISSSIDALTVSLDSFGSAVQPQIAQFNNLHKLGFFSGPNLEAIIESSEQGTSGDEIYTNGFRPITDAAALFGSISWRQTQQQAPSVGNEILINPRTGYVDLRKESRYIRFKQRIPYGTAWSFSAGIEPDPAIEGKD